MKLSPQSDPQTDRKRHARVAVLLLLTAMVVTVAGNIVGDVLRANHGQGYDYTTESEHLWFIVHVMFPLWTLSSALAIVGFIQLLRWKRMKVAAVALGLEIGQWAFMLWPLILGGSVPFLWLLKKWLDLAAVLVSAALTIALVLTLRRTAIGLGARFHRSLAIALYCLIAAIGLLTIVYEPLLELTIGLLAAEPIQPVLAKGIGVLQYGFWVILLGGTVQLFRTARSAKPAAEA